MTSPLLTETQPASVQLEQIKWRWPTLGVLALCIIVWLGALLLPLGWGLLQWVLLVFALTIKGLVTRRLLLPTH